MIICFDSVLIAQFPVLLLWIWSRNWRYNSFYPKHFCFIVDCSLYFSTICYVIVSMTSQLVCCCQATNLQASFYLSASCLSKWPLRPDCDAKVRQDSQTTKTSYKKIAEKFYTMLFCNLDYAGSYCKAHFPPQSPRTRFGAFCPLLPCFAPSHRKNGLYVP